MKRSSLPRAQRNVLRALNDGSDSQTAALAARTRLPHSSVYSALKGLMRRGLVGRRHNGVYEYFATRATPPFVAPGAVLPFYSTLAGKDSLGVLPRRYTGQTVTVIKQSWDGLSDLHVDEDTEAQWLVEAADGTRFHAWEGELNGHYHSTLQHVLPDGNSPVTQSSADNG